MGCARASDLVIIPEKLEGVNVVKTSSEVVVNTASQQRFDFVTGEYVLLPRQAVSIADVAAILWDRIAANCSAQFLLGTAEWMEVFVSDSFEEASFRSALI